MGQAPIAYAVSDIEDCTLIGVSPILLLIVRDRRFHQNSSVADNPHWNRDRRMDVSVLQRCWFLTGPTASGKSAVALELADRIQAEIISLDSMTIYRGMDIGTAKPNASDRQRIPHHLIDIADPHEEFSVAEFVTQAAQVAAEIVDRGRTPLFVGGTGLYLRSLLRGLATGPEADWTLRKQLELDSAKRGPAWLHSQLAECDPVTAARLSPNDQRRIIRALEVFHLSGSPISASQHHPPRPKSERPVIVLWLDPPRPWLCDRINRRVDQMISQGWLLETQALIDHQPTPSRTALQALGYRHLIDVLRNEVQLPVAVEQIKTSTRQFAKRQKTWFRNLEECMPLPVSGTESSSEIAETIIARAATSGIPIETGPAPAATSQSA
jgi:tRNA dimethylallyltransferase